MADEPKDAVQGDFETGASIPVYGDTASTAYRALAGVHQAPGEGQHGQIPKVPSELKEKLEPIYKRRSEESEAEAQRLQGIIDTGSRRSEQLFEASRHGADSMPEPWNADKMKDKYSTSPLASFGSAGVVFALMASAFTHAPMINGLNAAAAGIDAINKGDKENLQHAYQAWKDNTALALQRHRIQHEAFTDSIELMRTNVELGRASALANATRFGDKISQTMLEAGYMPEFIKMQNDRDAAALKWQQSAAQITANFERAKYWQSRAATAAGKGVATHPEVSSAAEAVEKLKRGESAEWGGFTFTKEDFKKVTELTQNPVEGLAPKYSSLKKMLELAAKAPKGEPTQTPGGGGPTPTSGSPRAPGSPNASRLPLPDPIKIPAGHEALSKPDGAKAVLKGWIWEKRGNEFHALQPADQSSYPGSETPPAPAAPVPPRRQQMPTGMQPPQGPGFVESVGGAISDLTESSPPPPRDPHSVR